VAGPDSEVNLAGGFESDRASASNCCRLLVLIVQTSVERNVRSTGDSRVLESQVSCNE
jgi:hypothetical protein